MLQHSFHSSQAVSNYVKSLGNLDNQLETPLKEKNEEIMNSNFKFSEVSYDEVQQRASFKKLLVSSLEMAFSFIFENSPNLIILIFVTHSGANLDEVSGFGLGVVYVNCLGLSLYFGLATGFEIIASHSYGAKKYDVVGLLLYKCFFIGFLMFIPICFCMIFSKEILHLWNSDIIICEYSRKYCVSQIPGIVFLGIYFIFKAYLNAQNEYRSQLYISALNWPFVFLYSYIFITYLELGVYGAAIVFNLNRLQNLIFLAIFIKRKPSLQQCFTKFTTEVFKNNWDFLKVVIPIGAIVCSDWIIYEVQSAIASNLDAVPYNAHLALSNFNLVFFCFALGYSTTSSTYIGNEMGRKNIKQAKKYGIYSMIIIFSHVAVVWLLLGFLREQFAILLTSQNNVKNAFINVYFIFLFQNSLDSIQNVTSGYLRAIGKEALCSLIFLSCNGVIGLTMSYFLAFQIIPHDNQGLDGIWWGLIIGIGANMLLQISVILFTNLEKMMMKIHQRIDKNDINNNLEKIQSMSLH